MVERLPPRVVVKNHEKIRYTPGDFYSFRHTFHTKDRYLEKHWHNSLEITYVVKGLKIQEMNNKRIVAKTGDLLLVNSGVMHDVDVKYPFEGIVLLIDINYIYHIYPSCINKAFNLELNLEAKNKIIEYLFDLVETYENGNRIWSHIIVLKIIDLLTSKLMEKDYYIRENHDDEVYELALSIAEYLDYNYYNKIGLGDIAGIFNYNKTYVSTIFKKKMGVTIFEYLNNVRMQHVLDDLKMTKDSIVDIALTNGFANIQVFNKRFKEFYNMTPKQYRDKIKKNNNFDKKKQQ